MRNIIILFSTVVLAFLLHLFLPWWAIALAGLISGIVLNTKLTGAFFIPFLAGILLWGGMSAWLSINNDWILATRIGELFGQIGPLGILAVTGLYGGIMAGVGGLTGNLLRQLSGK